MPVIDYFSMVTTPLTPRANDLDLGPATGFFYEHNGRAYLVSNWHVFSGRNAYSGQPMHSSGATPDEFSFLIHTRELGAFRSVTLKLNDMNENPFWLQHPRGQDVDIAAIEIAHRPDGIQFYYANNHCRNDLVVSVAAEAFVLGYPQGMQKQGIAPIWKRATIATEPAIALDDGSSAFLVNTATREGMSGSPVYVRADGVARLESGNTAMMTMPVCRLVGVYSGRFGEDEFSAQLGRVFPVSLLEELLQSSERGGAYQLRKVRE